MNWFVSSTAKNVRFGFLPVFRVPWADPSIISFYSGQVIYLRGGLWILCAKCNVKSGFVHQELYGNFARLSRQRKVALQDY